MIASMDPAGIVEAAKPHMRVSANRVAGEEDWDEDNWPS